MNPRSRDRITNFLEELAWLLKNYADLSYDELVKFVRSLRGSSTAALQDFAPANPNIAFLVGALPGLFLDRRLFRRNEDIAQFSEKVLGIPINRFEKRSQYELIGFVVCEVARLDDRKLARVVAELKRIVSMKDHSESKSFVGGWNEVIRRLTAGARDEHEES